MSASFIFNQPEVPQLSGTLLLAHGAGAPMDSLFMELLAQGIAGVGLKVARFEFPYMAVRREDGRKRPPNPMPVLLDAFRGAYRECRADTDGPVYVAGKSMGGRVASMLADELGADGLLCFGYPFHPPGKPEKTRVDHLRTIATPTLIIQGTRDPFGKPDEVSRYALGNQVAIHWLDTGDHDFKPLKASGQTQQAMIGQAATACLQFVEGRG
ncbi:alpha/beta family hydrolase [Pseudomonas sp. OIL-1]|uniref:alpha/beta family hydrolase n=1 Tax=Pseudomonas sp. OIL-1 TaxID=2706126 RepID=UPI0013A774BE|nr:alpha/beta family hydrolase [Pseudomonas sp. OIL-1]QIB51733.1 alpha/beta hydrolase [Pseudomonas sp. OIL-1]